MIADLNRTLRGWFGYFKHAHPFIFTRSTGRSASAARAPAQAGEAAGNGPLSEDHRRWPNAFFANAGLFALHAAWHAARQSR